MNKLIQNYYEHCFEKAVFDENDQFDKEKNKLLSSLFVENKYLYKFFSFDNNKVLNKKKLKTLQKEQIWCSPYYDFFDKTEFGIQFDIQEYKRKVSSDINILGFIEYIKRISNLASFTYENTNYMWNEYSNKGNGFCIKYEVVDSNMFFPVLYDKKNSYDFTEDLIVSFEVMEKAKSYNDIQLLNNLHFKRLSILPFVLKDAETYNKEKEIRLLDKVDYINIDNNYHGKLLSLNEAGLKVSKVILDFDNCLYREEILKIAKENSYVVEFR